MGLQLSNIYSVICERFEGIGDRLFIENAPTAVSSPMGSYLVVDVTDVARSRGTYSPSELNIWVGVRNRDSGVQNLTKIDKLVNEVLSRIPYSDDLLSITNPTIEVGIREGVFSYSVITCNLIIKHQ